MDNLIEQARKVVISLLPQKIESMTENVIVQTVDMALTLPIFQGKVNRDLLISQITSLCTTFLGDYKILDQDKPTPWIQNKKAEIKWNFWNRYRELLEREKQFAPAVINKLDNLTDDILDRLIDPMTEGFWDKRGMIVGQVQSGKTSNYIGLICKSADVGFRLIIVIAGMHDTLRSQTQLRIDEGFVGFDTQMARSLKQVNNRIGVGRIDPQWIAQPLTTSSFKGDFKRSAADSHGHAIRGKDPIIVVVKKNVSILKNLAQWLAVRGETMPDGKKLIKDIPLLLIDDEADNASINISKRKISAINGSIRSLLSLFGQSAYIGYTATPFANIFIPLLDEKIAKGLNISIKDFEFTVGQDLSPQDFIINIPTPSNYTGPKEVFGIQAEVSEEDNDENSGLPIVVAVDDFHSLIPNRHKKDDPLPEDLPDSLKEAIKCFLLSCAIRRARGQIHVHNSMLVHVTRFVRWQDKIADLVDLYLKFYQRQLAANLGDLKKSLKKLYENEYMPVTDEMRNMYQNNNPLIKILTWDEIESHLYPASAPIEVRAIHGDKNLAGLNYQNITPLDYFEYEQNNRWLSVIAVGGDKLSRGLTLEGLSISYYLRASKMYDTLMQMGRWFGYRPAYLDLCRLFTSEELIEWYKHITLASEELREEFDYMVFLNKTPRDYGLKIRTHPGVLKITAANKFRHSFTMKLSYSGSLIETYEFKKDNTLFNNNFESTRNFIAELGEAHKKNNQQYVWDTDYSKVLEFLSFYKTFQANIPSDKLHDYIVKQTKYNYLLDWTIVLINNTRPKNKPFEFEINGMKENIGLTFRRDTNKKNSEVYSIPKSHIISPSHEFIDFDKNHPDYQWALEETKKANPGKKITLPGGKFIRIARGRRKPVKGLLLIYPLDMKGCEGGNVEVPITGYAISFPQIENDQPIKYAVNEQFMKDELDYPDELDVEEYDE